jgi:hypothetical protein
MKRTEVKTGTEYAVMTPSQSVSGYGRDARRVYVLDAAVACTDNGGQSWVRSNSKDAKVTLPDGTKAEVTDYAHIVEEPKPNPRSGLIDPFSAKRYGQAKGYVLVLEYVSWNKSWQRRAVQLSHLRMTWAEYQSQKADAERARDRSIKAQIAAGKRQDAARRQAATDRDGINELLEGTAFTAKLVDGQVVIAGSLENVAALARTLRQGA